MLVTIWPLLAAIIGILVYALASNSKVVEGGRCLMWCGVLVTLLYLAHQTVKFGS